MILEHLYFGNFRNTFAMTWAFLKLRISEFPGTLLFRASKSCIDRWKCSTHFKHLICGNKKVFLIGALSDNLNFVNVQNVVNIVNVLNAVNVMNVVEHKLLTYNFDSSLWEFKCMSDNLLSNIIRKIIYILVWKFCIL